MADTKSSERELSESIVKALHELKRDVLTLRQRLDEVRSAARGGMSKPWRAVEQYGQEADEALVRAELKLGDTLAFARQGMVHDSELRSDNSIH